LKRNPVFFYYPTVSKNRTHSTDIAVAIDTVIQKRLDAMDALESQFYEGGANGSAELVPDDPQTARAEAAGPRGL